MRRQTSQPFGRPGPSPTARDGIAGLGRITAAKIQSAIRGGTGTKTIGCDGIPILSLRTGAQCDAGGVPVNVIQMNGKTYEMLGALGIGGAASGSSSTVAIDSNLVVPGAGSRIVYVGTPAYPGGAGLFRSDDWCATWAPANAGLPVADVHSIVFYNLNHNVLYAALGTSGVWRSPDGGATWAATASLGGESARWLAFHPTNGALLFVATLDGSVYYTFDEGATWTAKVDGLAGGNPALGFAIATGGVLYFTLAGPDGTVYLNRCTALDQPWTQVPPTPDAEWTFWEGGAAWIVPDFGHSSEIFLGAETEIRKSSENGTAFALITVPSLPQRALYGALAVDPRSTTSTILYVGVTGGVSATYSGGPAWGNLLIADQDNLGYPPALEDVGSVVLDPAAPDVMYVGDHRGTPGALGIWKSPDAGLTWAKKSTGLIDSDGGLGHASVNVIAIP